MEANESFSPLTKSDFPYIDGEMENENAGAVETSPTTSNNGVSGRGDATPGPPKTGQKNDGMLSVFGRYSFPFLLASSVIKLSIYLNKLYQDSSAVGKYYNDSDLNYCIVSAFCLFLPPIIYIMYIVSAYIKDHAVPESKEVGTKVVHGILLVPWQIKGRVEVLQFSAQRVCQRRLLTADELQEKSVLERQAACLEFFEEFYAGLIQMLLQLYIIIIALDEATEYKALTGEIIASALTLMSMMAAVRRRDDGILTGTLSMLGWLSITVSRTVAIALATTVIHGWMIVVCILHGAVISSWITRIAIRTHCEQELNTSAALSGKRKLALFFLVFSVFGLPSLTYWPIMFELKQNKRPMVFLFVLLLENVLFVALWMVFDEKVAFAKHDYVLLFMSAGLYVLGALFILFYVCCKPKYTDQVVYHDMKALNADSFGMYFEFCDVAFRLSRKQDIETRLRDVREHRIVPL